MCPVLCSGPRAVRTELRFWQNAGGWGVHSLLPELHPGGPGLRVAAEHALVTWPHVEARERSSEPQQVLHLLLERQHTRDGLLHTSDTSVEAAMTVRRSCGVTWGERAPRLDGHSGEGVTSEVSGRTSRHTFSSANEKKQCEISVYKWRAWTPHI